MSEPVPPSAYKDAPGALAPEKDNFKCQFRLLLMRVFMDNLGKEQVLKFHFLCEMPEKLRDHEANLTDFRFEILKYVQHQLMHEWSQTPSSLQALLVYVGRTDLSLQLQELVARYRSETPDAERLPIEETQQPPAANISPRRQHNGTDSHATLKRTPSNASNSSERSSGYYSNPRSSEPRFSQLSMLPEPIAEVEEEETDNVPYASIKQSGCDKDEGLCLDIDCTGEFASSLRINEEERSTSGSDSSTLGSDSGDSPTRAPFRGRACQYLGERRSSKQKELASELDDSLGRSASLPTDCRIVGRRLRSIGSSNSSIDSSTSGSTCGSLQRQPIETELNITGSMKVDIKAILKSVDKKDSQPRPLVSREFPSKSQGYHGTSFEIRFILSDFSEKNASLYIAVSQSYLKKRSSKKEPQSMVEVKPMKVNVTLLSVASGKDGECGACSDAEAGATGCCQIKSESVETELKRIDSRSKTKEKGLIASFPQIVSHEELKQLRAGHSLVIRVNMSV